MKAGQNYLSGLHKKKGKSQQIKGRAEQDVNKLRTRETATC